MKKEKLFRALADIGDDLIEMAEKRSFAPNMWRKWGALAASIALVLCLSVLVLPYFPMGCGSASMEPESDNMEQVDQESVIEDAVPEEAPDMNEEPAEEEVDGTDDTVGLTLVFDGRLYNVTKRFASDELTEQDVGEYLGVVEEAPDEAWIGCPVYSYRESQRKAILVELPGEYLYCTLPLE